MISPFRSPLHADLYRAYERLTAAQRRYTQHALGAGVPDALIAAEREVARLEALLAAKP